MLERGRAATDDLLARIPARHVATPGLGGGAWSARDLIGHLASWEEYALEAMRAWDRGDRAEIDRMWFTVSTAELNAANVERKAAWPLAKVRRESSRTHEELLAAFRARSEAAWRAPATARARKPLGVRIGGILGGPAGPFRHDEAHHESLRSFLQGRGW
jgi:hypothetical protein